MTVPDPRVDAEFEALTVALTHPALRPRVVKPAMRIVRDEFHEAARAASGRLADLERAARRREEIGDV